GDCIAQYDRVELIANDGSICRVGDDHRFADVHEAIAADLGVAYAYGFIDCRLSVTPGIGVGILEHVVADNDIARRSRVAPSDGDQANPSDTAGVERQALDADVRGMSIPQYGDRSAAGCVRVHSDLRGADI